jgi:uncharacterized protein
MILTRRSCIATILALPLSPGLSALAASKPTRLIVKARQQIGVTTRYDGAYVALAYPGGDVPRDRGVCIDVVIRAYRDAFAFDFQVEINKDMRANFDTYPKRWGLTRTDRNIDHRRVPNLETWLRRHGHEQSNTDWQPGDLITCLVKGHLPHIGIISTRRDRQGRYKAIHNIGLGTREDSRIWAYDNLRRFRFLPS